MDIDRSQFGPEQRFQLKGMSAQAALWFLHQIEINEITPGEALQIALHLQSLAVEIAVEHGVKRKRKSPT